MLAIEPFAIKVRADNNIRGLLFHCEEIKILTYIDDTTASLASIEDT